MNSRLAIALCLSVILIGGATWERASRKSTVANLSLTVVNAASTSTDTAGTEVATPPSPPPAGTSTPLTDTDLIGRQLFSEYVQLSANGQATQSNLDSLASQYADNIAGLDKSAKISSEDLRIVPDNHSNFQTYADKLTLVYNKYHGLIAEALAEEAGVNSTGPAYTKVTSTLSSIYSQEAAELKIMSVPASLADDQVALINIYLGDAWGYSTISTIETSDSATAFAGAAITNQNVTAEQDTISDIEKVLTANGI